MLEKKVQEALTTGGMNAFLLKIYIRAARSLPCGIYSDFFNSNKQNLAKTSNSGHPRIMIDKPT